MLKAAAVFSHNMVLQRDKNISIWGRGTDGAAVSVSLAVHTGHAIVENGMWNILLPPLPAGGPYQMQITGGTDVICFDNVMLGEVWLAGGQSNMELELHTSKDGEAFLQTLTPAVNVRFYYTPKQAVMDEAFYTTEENTCWAEATPESARAWSAVGFYFARQLAQRLGVTVGILGCNWGGTSATAWMRRERIENCVALSPYLETYDKAMAGKTAEQHAAEYDAYIEYSKEWNRKMQACYAENPDCPWEEIIQRCGESQWPGPMGPKNEYRIGGLYETMLQRICPYTLRGFLYYQGESDDHQPALYHRLLTELIGLWREDWGDDTLPFLLVQLPMFRYKQEEDRKHWCLIREAQDRVFRTLRNTGLAVTLDCGELDNIHPTDKEPVGNRLAWQALAEVYGDTEVSAYGPMYHSYLCENGTMRLHFSHAEDGFFVQGDTPLGFSLAGADKQFYPATAVCNGNEIILSANEVPIPVYARYAWTNYMVVNVFGTNGIPLAPFRTSMQDS